MNCLPVIERELRVLVRVPRTYYARSLGALVAAVMSLGMLYVGFGGLLSANSAGKNLFLGLSLLAYVYVLIDGAFLTSDCLSQEKRDGTMGLLFLTDLKGYDIVAGKLLSRSLNAGYCVLAALPALGLSIFLGGVTGADFYRMILALLNGLFFSVSLGILVSAFCRNERRALSGALFGVLLFGFIVPVIGFSLQHFTSAPAVHPLFLLMSPAGSFLSALQLGNTIPTPLYFGSSWFTTHCLSWFFLALASIVLPRSWQDKPTTPRFSIRRWVRLKSWRSASQPLSRGKAGRWLNINPVLWLGERPGQKGLGVAAALTLCVVGWICGGIFFRSLWFDLPVYFFSAFFLHVVLMYATALQACRGAAEDRRSSRSGFDCRRLCQNWRFELGGVWLDRAVPHSRG
jgi:ABC-type transport system involved in multi-copper enzyme maturation permease subunit